MAQTTQKKIRIGRRSTPVLCNVFGIAMLVMALVTCLPLTVPRLMGYEVYKVDSASMEPAIPFDGVVYVQRTDPAEVEVNDVIAYKNEGSVALSRVVANHPDEREFVAKSDANYDEDPESISYGSFVGTEAASVPVLGKFMDLYASKAGKVYLTLLVACGVMLNMLARRLREERRRAIEQSEAAGVSVLAEDSEAVRESRRIYRRRLRVTAMIVLATVFLGSAGAVAYFMHQRAENDRIYDETSQLYTDLNEGDDGTSGIVAPKTVDFDKLLAANKDIVGWIYCENTPIDYPVLQGKTNDDYLRHVYTGEYNINGSIFVDCRNKRGFSDASTIVYGHHMNHGAMFGSLEEWANQKYYEKHPTMWLLTPEQDYQIVIVSGHHTSAYSDMYDIYRKHDDSFERFLKEAEDQTEIVPLEGATIDPRANYVMLTTCAYIFDNARFVLHGKLEPVNSAGGVPLNK